MIDIIDLIARGGGGGSGGGGGGAGGILALPFVLGSMIWAWWKRKKKIERAKRALSSAENQDPAWRLARDQAEKVFTQFQHDWSNFDLASMQTYLSPHYYAHMHIMLEALQQMNRQNTMSDLVLSSVTMMNVKDSKEDTQDNFDVEMKAIANDRLINTTNNTILFEDHTPFTEFWNFTRQGDRWLLNEIKQLTAGSSVETGFLKADINKLKVTVSSRMQRFAQHNGFFYNADFGWLLLPTRGELFTLANFGRSDINYHVLGKYHDVLVQFYEYVPVVPDKRRFMDYFRSWYKAAYRYEPYVVAQTILPKAYGNIIVKRKNSIGTTYKPKGMWPMSLEGVEFSKKFSVYATDLERATSLELLHPAYMSKLLDLPFKVNIEIVDNVLYLYSTDKGADLDAMLALLKDAFEEMKM